MLTLLSVVVPTLLIIASLTFAIFGPMILAKQRKTKLSPVAVLLLTVLTLPTAIGWAVILAYSLFGETKETR